VEPRRPAEAPPRRAAPRPRPELPRALTGPALTEQSCVACRRDAPTVTDEEIAELQPQVPDWDDVDGVKRLTRTFGFDDFAQALAFTDRVGRLAEHEGHHPALLTEWGRTTVSWWTHKIKGLHRNDFVMAAKTDRLYDGS
jgi:4a-hydroxytetrahydrobiopterin dehydratase